MPEQVLDDLKRAKGRGRRSLSSQSVGRFSPWGGCNVRDLSQKQERLDGPLAIMAGRACWGLLKAEGGKRAEEDRGGGGADKKAIGISRGYSLRETKFGTWGGGLSDTLDCLLGGSDSGGGGRHAGERED